MTTEQPAKREPPEDSLIVFNAQLEAEEAMRLLNARGFAMRKLSLVGKAPHSDQHAVGSYRTRSRIQTWGRMGACCGGAWGLLFAPALILVPGNGVLALASPVVTALAGVLEGAVFVGGISALGAALTKIRVPKDQVIRNEWAPKARKHCLVVHGSPEEVAKARSVLDLNFLEGPRPIS